jgi:IS5 family transposase
MVHFGLTLFFREGGSPMLRDRYAPMDLFTFVPALSLALEPVLAQLDQLLDDDALVQGVKADLLRRAPHTATRGRRSTPVEVILRMLVVKRLYGWSYEETEQFVADSLVLRQFCRIYLEAVPDDTTLLRWANLIEPTTLAVLNDRVVELARSLRLTRGRKLRVDSMVVETHIHHPTDSRLLGDGVHVLSRWLRRAKRVLADRAPLSRTLFRSRTRSVRRLAQQIHRLARRKGEEAAEQLQAAYARLLAVARQSCRQAERVQPLLVRRRNRVAQRIAARLAQYLPLVRQAICQAQRRVLDGGQVPAGEKLLSVFEPHTQVIQRHKPGKPVEFGRKVWLAEVEGGLISEYRMAAQPGPDAPYLVPSLTRHISRFGKPPHVLAGDRGVYTADNEHRAQHLGVKRVAIPYAGRASPQRRHLERASWFRRGFRFRAGIEGRISVLRRRFGLARCLAHGEAGLGRWVGWGVLTANLVQMAHALVKRQVAPTPATAA